jgi:hypothetical protein
MYADKTYAARESSESSEGSKSSERLDREARAKVTSSKELKEQNIRIFQMYCYLSNYKKQICVQSYVGEFGTDNGASLSFETCVL